jgi:hypothetical protein
MGCFDGCVDCFNDGVIVGLVALFLFMFGIVYYFLLVA